MEINSEQKERDLDDVLEEILSRTPCPDRKAKQLFNAGRMSYNAKISAVEKYSGYKCRVVCFYPEETEESEN